MRDADQRRFTDEENDLYRKNVDMIRVNIAGGVKFDVACEFVKVEDKGLRDMIIDDALKIEIAELHYGKRMPLIDMAKKLGVAMERLLKANHEMMEDIIHTAGEFSKEQSGNTSSLTH